MFYWCFIFPEFWIITEVVGGREGCNPFQKNKLIAWLQPTKPVEAALTQ
jgi:hypothetical protein